MDGTQNFLSTFIRAILFFLIAGVIGWNIYLWQMLTQVLIAMENQQKIFNERGCNFDKIIPNLGADKTLTSGFYVKDNLERFFEGQRRNITHLKDVKDKNYRDSLTKNLYRSEIKRIISKRSMNVTAKENLPVNNSKRPKNVYRGNVDGNRNVNNNNILADINNANRGSIIDKNGNMNNEIDSKMNGNLGCNTGGDNGNQNENKNKGFGVNGNCNCNNNGNDNCNNNGNSNGNNKGNGNGNGNENTGVSSNGVLFTRWGRVTCGSQGSILYEGVAAGLEHSSLTFGGQSLYCIKNDAQVLTSSTAGKTGPSMSEAKFELLGSFPTSSWKTSDKKRIPCSVCSWPANELVTMFGSSSCHNDWRTIYSGFVISPWSDGRTNVASTALCLDSTPESSSLNAADVSNTNAPGYSFVRSSGSAFPDAGRIIPCVVCAK